MRPNPEYNVRQALTPTILVLLLQSPASCITYCSLNMARSCLFYLIFAGILVLQAMCDEKSQSEVVNPKRFEEEEAASSPLAETESSSSGLAEAPGIRKLGKHHSSDKSVAGAGVIIAGLVAVIFAAVFCYIRVTRKRHVVDHHDQASDQK